jgi:hypothetical protein
VLALTLAGLAVHERLIDLYFAAPSSAISSIRIRRSIL